MAVWPVQMVAELTVITSGCVLSNITFTVAVFVQPLIASVAVTVYVPAAVTVAGFGALERAPPFHTNVLPELVPVSVTEATEQDKFPLLAAVTSGGAVLVETVTSEVSLQPFASVAVTKYAPAAATVAGFPAFASEPPFQTIVPVLLADKVTELLEQVRLAVGGTVIIGGVAIVACVVVSMLAQSCAIAEAVDTTGLTEMYLMQPG